MQNEEVCPEWRPGESVSFWINRASRLLLRLQDERLRPYGLGMSQMPVLHALEDGGALSQKELAQRARVEQPTMAEMLSRMERDGVVEREPNPEDRRGTLISLSRRARSRWPKGKVELMAVEGEATAGLSAADKAQLLALLRRFVENLEGTGAAGAATAAAAIKTTAKAAPASRSPRKATAARPTSRRRGRRRRQARTAASRP